jgi:hypothetical protein
LILSRHRILSYRFEVFDDAIGFDSLADKGAIVATIEVGDEERGTALVVIGATHLQAGGGDNIEVVRASQITQCSEMIRSVEKVIPDHMVNHTLFAFAGDFNVRERSNASDPTTIRSEYTNLIDTIAAESIDAYREILGDEPGSTFIGSDARLDYIFQLTEFTDSSSHYINSNLLNAGIDNFVQDESLSDHLAVYATFEVTLNPDQKPQPNSGFQTTLSFINIICISIGMMLLHVY